MGNVPGIEIGNFSADDAFEHLLASVVDKPEEGHTVDQEEVEHGHDKSTSAVVKFIAVIRQHGILGLVAPQVRGGLEVQQALPLVEKGL